MGVEIKIVWTCIRMVMGDLGFRQLICKMGTSGGVFSLSLCTVVLPVLSAAMTPESHMVPGVAACKVLPGCPQAAITAPGTLKVYSARK